MKDARTLQNGFSEKGLTLARNRPLLFITLLYSTLWCWAAFEPYNRFDWLLENLLIFVAVITLAATYRLFVFGTLSYALIAFFLALHTIGAHYSYNTTPLDDLLHRLFPLHRDPYDRIVHFSFGLLLVHPVRELIRRVVGLRSGWSHPFAVSLIMACAAFYELIEMWVAQIVAPEIGTLFLGTQGDPWDTQHDMEVALYGAAITTLMTLLASAVRKKTV